MTARDNMDLMDTIDVMDLMALMVPTALIMAAAGLVAAIGVIGNSEFVGFKDICWIRAGPMVDSCYKVLELDSVSRVWFGLWIRLILD